MPEASTGLRENFHVTRSRSGFDRSMLSPEFLDCSLLLRQSTATLLSGTTPMAASESSRYLARSLPRAFVPSARPQVSCWCRNASSQASSRSPAADLNELESSGALTSAVSIPESTVKSFDPASKAKGRKKQLPRSR